MEEKQLLWVRESWSFSILCFFQQGGISKILFHTFASSIREFFPLYGVVVGKFPFSHLTQPLQTSEELFLWKKNSKPNRFPGTPSHFHLESSTTNPSIFFFSFLIFFSLLKSRNQSKLQTQPLKLPDKTHTTPARYSFAIPIFSLTAPAKNKRAQAGPGGQDQPFHNINQGWATKKRQEQKARVRAFQVLPSRRARGVPAPAGICSRGAWIPAVPSLQGIWDSAENLGFLSAKIVVFKVFLGFF